MNNINFISGDATYPIGTGQKMIVHCCNDAGVWGTGFVNAISKRWQLPRKLYIDWSKNKVDLYGRQFKLGEVQYVQVENDIIVANIIGQHNYGNKFHLDYPFIRYDAINDAFLKIIASYTTETTIHMPRLGCGLAGGSWVKTERLINDIFIKNGFGVTVYDF